MIKILGDHTWWKTQLVQDPAKRVRKEGLIKEIDPATVDAEPMALPPGFEWDMIDAKDDATMSELADFLNDHYVEGAAGDFRLAYTKEFLQWAYQADGNKREYAIAVRNSKNKKLMATLMCIVCKIQAFENTIVVCETNFAAVHHKLRDKKLGQILITELLRRTRKDGLPIGFY